MRLFRAGLNDSLYLIFYTGGRVIRPYFGLFIRPLFFRGVQRGWL